MVGLSVVLEAQKKTTSSSLSKKSPQVINKLTMTKTTPPCSSPSSTFVPAAFLAKCCLCNKKLLPGKDIYMYKGDIAFCSVECRCRQIFMDEENHTAAIMYSSNKNSNTYNVKKTTNCSSAASGYTNTTRNPAFEFSG